MRRMRESRFEGISLQDFRNEWGKEVLKLTDLHIVRDATGTYVFVYNGQNDAMIENEHGKPKMYDDAYDVYKDVIDQETMEWFIEDYERRAAARSR